MGTDEIAMSEKQLQDQLKKDYLKQYAQGVWRKTHGNQHSSGQPDILLSCVDGAAAIELKWCKDIRHNIAESIEKLVTPLQKVRLKEYDMAYGPIRPRVIIGAETPDGIIAVSVPFHWKQELGTATFEQAYESCIETNDCCSQMTFSIVRMQLRKPRIGYWDLPFLLGWKQIKKLPE